MSLIIHVIIALSSIGLTTYAYLRPSSRVLRGAYGAIGLTIASGVYLVVVMPSHMLQACMSGLLYLGFVSIGIIAARSRLARRQAALDI
jgi:hypothetical protein